MREADRVEVGAFGRSPKQALRSGLFASDWAVTAKVDGRPEAMFGVVTESAIEGMGRPWMLGTEAVYSCGRELVREGPTWASILRDSFRRLENLVSADNAPAIRLLQRWGFTVEEDAQMIGGVTFRTFWMER